jgi:hypothetical protein
MRFKIAGANLDVLRDGASVAFSALTLTPPFGFLLKKLVREDTSDSLWSLACVAATGLAAATGVAIPFSIGLMAGCAAVPVNLTWLVAGLSAMVQFGLAAPRSGEKDLHETRQDVVKDRYEARE